MKKDIFIGDIRKCTKYEEQSTYSGQTYINDECILSDSFGYILKRDEIFKKDAILVKIKNGGYVDLENLNSFLDHLKICKEKINGYKVGGLMMDTQPDFINELFVDENTLKPYYNDSSKKIKIRKLKKGIKTIK